MLAKLFPDETARSVYEVDYEALYRAGFRLAVYDIDNTLVLHEEPATEQAARLMEQLHAVGFRAAVLSNNHVPRVRSFAEAAGMDAWIADAGKPSPDGFRRLAEQMGVSLQEMIFFGDQLFTDIWAARNAGVRSVLVNPVGPEIYAHIRLKRMLETPVLRLYRKNHPGFTL